jgi:hypothetical protein
MLRCDVFLKQFNRLNLYLVYNPLYNQVELYENP